MHDHNLDDLIIDNIEPKNSKTKSLLTIIAFMIVVLIVAIILTKILLKTPAENRLVFEENATELIAPELQLKEEVTLSKTTKEPNKAAMTDLVSKKDNSKLETELSVSKRAEADKKTVLSNIDYQEIKAPEAKKQEPIAVQEPMLTHKEKEAKKAKDAADIAYWKAIQEKRKAEKIAYEARAPENPTVMIKKQKTVNPVVTSSKKSVKTPVATKSLTPKTLSTGRYYVQVGAYRQQPSPRFISVIRNNGYKYIITKPDRNGIKRLLIGPYKNKASVDRILIDVRDRIHKRAFIIKR